MWEGGLVNPKVVRGLHRTDRRARGSTAPRAAVRKGGHDEKHVVVTNPGGAVAPGGNPTYYCTVVGVAQTSTGNVAGGNPSILLACTPTANGPAGSAAVY